MGASMNLRRKYRWQLLTGASAIALLTNLYSTGNANATDRDADRPLLWIDLGWHYDGISGMGNAYNPAFAGFAAQNGFSDPLKLQKNLGYGYGGNAKFTFRPEDSDWSFSAALQYGRAHGHRSNVQQTADHPATGYGAFYLYKSDVIWISNPVDHYIIAHFPGAKFSNTSASQRESHTIIDFMAGKDVGLGILGTHGASTLGAGVRFAELSSRSGANLAQDPDFHITQAVITFSFSVYRYLIKFPSQQFHEDIGVSENEQSFRGLGPSLYWNASTALAGNPQDGEISLDWGINAALLFGKQNAKGHHKTTSYFFTGSQPRQLAYQTGASHDRSRTVAIPNVGGFAGMSYRFVNAGLKLGYRADFFFNAIDGGIDTRHDVTRGFYGPYASISFGLGD